MEKKLNFVKNGVIRLPPGFRFHPTDEELVMQYLRRKVFSYPLPASIIPDIDLCKYEPWDLPGDTEQERYFFSTKEAKYKNGNRPNRATSSGYWKATGLDKKILLSKSQNQVVGMKKTLVFYKGKPSNATRTDWIMHEYRLLEENSVQENWVLCRIFLKKRNTKNGMENKEVVELTLGRPRFIDFMTRDNNLSPSSSSSSCSSGVTEASSSDENSFTSSSCRRAP